MNDQYTLHIVTGAPGTGKSSTVEAFANSPAGAVALDIDWLINSASSLAGKDIHLASDSWPAYNQLWLDVLFAILRNGRDAVLFAPITPDDVNQLPDWCSNIQWLLLDCPDHLLRVRLQARGWKENRIIEALKEAADLRDMCIEKSIDTSRLTPTDVAALVARWMKT
jgi:hypothetical protein